MPVLYIENIKGLLVKPLERFELLRDSTLTLAYQQYILLLVMYSVLLGIVSLLSFELVFSSFLINIGSLPLIGSFLIVKCELFRPFLTEWNLLLVYVWFLILMFLIFLKGFFLHAFVILLGGEQGIKKTLLVILYAATPFLLIGWIPYIWIIGLIWSIILFIIGIKIIQNLSWPKAAATIIIPLLLGIIILILGNFLILSLIEAIGKIV